MDRSDLEKRITAIEDRQAIHNLRHTYWYAILDRDLESYLNCYSEDAHSDIGFGHELTGQAQLRAFYEKYFANEDLLIQTPRGANGLIELLDETHARGRWLVEVVIIKKSQDYGVRNGVQYNEEYTKIDGAWKISRQKNKYLHWETMALRTGPQAGAAKPASALERALATPVTAGGTSA